MACPSHVAQHRAPLSRRLEQGGSCGTVAAFSLLGSLMIPRGTVVEWFLCLSKSSLLEQIQFSSRIRGHASGSGFLKFIISFCMELSLTV